MGLWEGIGAMAGAAGQLGTGMMQGSQNRKANKRNMQFNQAAVIAQNLYNDPMAERDRLQRAGLNDQLMYGGGHQGGSTQIEAPEYKAADLSNYGNAIQQGVSQYFDYRQKNSELQAHEKNMLLVDAQIAQMQANTSESLFRTARSKFDLDLASEIRNNTVGMSSETYAGMKLQNSLKQLDLVQMPQKFKMDLAMDAQRLKNLSAQLTSEELENELKRIRNKYAHKGINFQNMGLATSILAGAAGLPSAILEAGKNIKEKAGNYLDSNFGKKRDVTLGQQFKEMLGQ